MVEPGGSKGSLKPKARDARGGKQPVLACYIRDRDFDRDPPAELSAPLVDAYVAKGSDDVLGWCWCRHEIESYLIDPRLVAKAAPALAAGFAAALLEAAGRIQTYTAARWAVGVARRGLPPLKELPTRPAFLTAEFEVVPRWFGVQTEALEWATGHTSEFGQGVGRCLSATAIVERFEEELALTTTAIAAARSGSFDVLLARFPGKDLMAALDRSAYRPLGGNPVDLRRALRDWLRAHPDEALALFSEWEALRKLLQA